MENIQQDREDEVKRIFTNTAKSYEFIVNATTLGMDGMWKKRMIDSIDVWKKNIHDKTLAAFMDPPFRILDLACGTGLLTFTLAKQYPEADIVGMDIMQEYLDIAQSKVKPGDKITFIRHNADDLENAGPAFQQFDLIISSYIPKYIDFPKLLKTCHKFLAPGGLMLFHDFTRPRRWVYRAFYNLYWFGLSRMLYFSPAWRDMGKDLKNIIWRSDWVGEFQQFYCIIPDLKETDVLWQPFDIACIVYAVKKV